MIFEKAINEAATMFLFDRRSQQQLHEMAEEAVPNSKDRFLIRLTQAAFTYYNDYESQGWDIRNSLRQAMAILQEVKRFRSDRVFFTLALRMEVDILLHQSRLNFQEAPKKEKLRNLYNEEDARALSICDTLLKNFPPSLDPLPNAWYTSLIPLFPTFHDETLRFYADRVKENRIDILQNMLKKVRGELIIASAMVMAKKFLSRTKVNLLQNQSLYQLLLASAREVLSRVEERLPRDLQVVSDVNLPKGITLGQIDLATQDVQVQIDEANVEKDMRKYTASLLQMGILNFLRQSEGGTIQSLVNTLRASANLDPKSKESRQYRHDTFADIPFMIGTAFLRLGLAAREQQEDGGKYFNQSRTALLRALLLNPGYHQAYVNLVLAMGLGSETGLEEVVQAYLDKFGGDIELLDSHIFRNLTALELQGEGAPVTPESVKWMIVSHFSRGGDFTKGKKMLQDLKTLYILNAHNLSSQHLETYRSAFRLKDEEFIADVEDDFLHSALLFYISHGFASRSLIQAKGNKELTLNHEYLDQSIELNTDALYFNAKNSSAIRLVETQSSIIQFALKRSEKRWEQINSNISNRFTFYENYLREIKSYEFLKERMASVKLESLVPEIKFSPDAALRMDVTLTSEQRERLQTRVKQT